MMHIGYCLGNGLDYYYKNRISSTNKPSPSLSRRRNVTLTQQEESQLKSNTFRNTENPASNYSTSGNQGNKSTLNDVSKELQNFKSCLNTTIVWSATARQPIDVSVSLLKMIIDIYSDNRTLLERFGISGFAIISIHPAFREFEAATAELQQISLIDLCEEEKFVFWINIFNTLSLHAYIRNNETIKYGLVHFIVILFFSPLLSFPPFSI